MTDDDTTKFTAKTEAETSSNADKKRITTKELEKPCTDAINTYPSVFLIHMENLTVGKYGGTD